MFQEAVGFIYTKTLPNLVTSDAQILYLEPLKIEEFEYFGTVVLHDPDYFIFNKNPA